MRSPTALLSIAIPLSIVACEAGDETSHEQATNAVNAQCTPASRAAILADMVRQPIVPPRLFGGLDVAGGDDWRGLTLDQAEQKLCASQLLSEDDSGNAYASWGDAGELQVGYSTSSKKIDFVQLNPGYRGKLQFSSRPGSKFGHHTYEVGVGSPILRDGAPWELRWHGRMMDDAQSTELYDAMVYTFAPELPGDDVNCRASGTCRAHADGAGGGGTFGARSLGMYFHVPSIVAAQPASSTPDLLYFFTNKILPFSNAEMFLKLDAEGPVAIARDLGDRTPKATCTMLLGRTFDSFFDDCVGVLSDSTANARLKTKLLGGARNEGGTWNFDVSGIHPSFAAASPSETEPHWNARVTELVVDVRSLGKLANELGANGEFNLAGTDAIYREYARLVQQELHARMDPKLPRHPIGAAECLAVPARGCTGMESIVTPSANVPRASFTTVLRPGDPTALFCKDCKPVGLWTGTHERVRDVLAHDDDSALPAEARDPAFYFRVWARAYVKYLKAAALRPTDLSRPEYAAVEPAESDFTFDASGFRYKNELTYVAYVYSSTVQELRFRK